MKKVEDKFVQLQKRTVSWNKKKRIEETDDKAKKSANQTDDKQRKNKLQRVNLTTKQSEIHTNYKKEKHLKANLTTKRRVKLTLW